MAAFRDPGSGFERLLCWRQRPTDPHAIGMAEFLGSGLLAARPDTTPLLPFCFVRIGNLMRRFFVLIGLMAIAAPAAASDSLFAKLVTATESSNWNEITQLLEMETLSTSTTSVGQDNRLIAGTIRHGVSAIEISEKLNGCLISRWEDVGYKWGGPFVLWECPTKRLPENECYFRVYRASFLNSRLHPANFFIHEMAKRGIERCGSILPPPPR